MRQLLTTTYTSGASLAAIDCSDDTPDVTRATDALGRPAGISLPDYDIDYGHDAYGRFSSVTSSVASASSGVQYSYLANSDLLETTAFTSGLTATRTYNPVMPYITHVHNGFTGDRTISQHDYSYDQLGRRTAIASSGEAFSCSNANDLAAFNIYGYNARSEVTAATRYWGQNTGDISEPVAGQEYAYAFDPIGNRITAAEGDTERTATYTANALNQYSQRTVPSVKELAGTAATNATVTVNDLATDRHGAWWRHAFEVDNALSAAYSQAVVRAVYNPPGTNDPDVVTSATGHVFVAETPEGFTYDDDGNLLSDGRFTYSWDAENRLTKVETRDDLPTTVPRVRLTYSYDYQWRRLETVREQWDGQDWEPVSTNRFVYDGWNLIADLSDRSAVGLSDCYYVWGLDLSGTLQGAGGIGGLLSVTRDPALDTRDYTFDANGNVSELAAANGTLAAHYEYSPFGATVVATGTAAADNPFRFSTKYYDTAASLYYYGYRHINPATGRWMSRDPLGEIGFWRVTPQFQSLITTYRLLRVLPANITGQDSYRVLRNAPVLSGDYLGLTESAPRPSEPGKPKEEPKEPCCGPPCKIVKFKILDDGSGGIRIKMKADLETEHCPDLILYWWTCTWGNTDRPWREGNLDADFTDTVVIIYAAIAARSCEGGYWVIKKQIAGNKCSCRPAVAGRAALDCDCTQPPNQGAPPHPIPDPL